MSRQYDHAPNASCLDTPNKNAGEDTRDPPNVARIIRQRNVRASLSSALTAVAHMHHLTTDALKKPSGSSPTNSRTPSIYPLEKLSPSPEINGQLYRNRRRNSRGTSRYLLKDLGSLRRQHQSEPSTIVHGLLTLKSEGRKHTSRRQ